MQRRRAASKRTAGRWIARPMGAAPRPSSDVRRARRAAVRRRRRIRVRTTRNWSIRSSSSARPRAAKWCSKNIRVSPADRATRRRRSRWPARSSAMLRGCQRARHVATSPRRLSLRSPRAVARNRRPPHPRHRLQTRLRRIRPRRSTHSPPIRPPSRSIGTLRRLKPTPSRRRPRLAIRPRPVTITHQINAGP